jgi:GNAT superfamily N-acetyltransferase
MTTEITDDRDKALEIGYAATNWQDPVTFDEYLNIAASWQVQLIVRDGEPIGAIFRKDGETHISVLPEWRRRWLSRGLLKKLLADTRLTRVENGHDFMYGVLERLGFRRQPDGTLTREC